MNIIRDLQNSKLPNGLTLREDTLLRAAFALEESASFTHKPNFTI